MDDLAEDYVGVGDVETGWWMVELVMLNWVWEGGEVWVCVGEVWD